MPETQDKEKVSRIIPMTADELIFIQLKDLKEEFRDSRKELNARMDRMEQRQDKLEAKLETTRKELNARMDKQDAKIDKLDEKIDTVRKELNARMDKQDDKIDKLADKIDALSGKIDSAMNHGQIITVSAISIAVGVLYAVFFK